MDPNRADSTDRFVRLVREHYSGLLDFAYSYAGSVQDAEDVVQEVLMQVWERRGEIDVQSSMRGYLYRAVRNRSLNVLRDAKRSANPDFEVDPSDTGPEDLHTFRELERTYGSAVSELPERQREAYRLSRLYGLTYTEIGEVMGTSVNTVRSQISAALRHLRERLADYL